MSTSVIGASSWRNVMQALRADTRSLVAAATLLLITMLVLIGPSLTAYAPYEQLDIINGSHLPPGTAHLLGTDVYSRDVLSRILSGGRISLSVAVGAVVLETFVGVSWGLIAGLAGRRIDSLMMRCVDAGMSVPRVLMLLALLVANLQFQQLARSADLADEPGNRIAEGVGRGDRQARVEAGDDRYRRGLQRVGHVGDSDGAACHGAAVGAEHEHGRRVAVGIHQRVERHEHPRAACRQRDTARMERDCCHEAGGQRIGRRGQRDLDRIAAAA
jgi:hypothetical protein